MVDATVKEKLTKHVKTLIKNNETVNITHIAEKYNVSWTTCQRWIKDAGITIPDSLKRNSAANEQHQESKPSFTIMKRDSWFKEEKNKAVKKEINENQIIIREVVPEPKFTDYSASSCVTATLISNRHEIDSNTGNNNKLYVFNGPLSNDKIHDYQYLEDTAKKFVMNNVIGKGCTKLKVFTTGLVQANAAIIKASMECGIALSFMNYDNTSYLYKEQIVIPATNENDSDEEGTLLWTYCNTKKDYKIQLVNSKASDYKNKNIIYVVKIDNIHDQRKGIHLYICDNLKDMFFIYQREVEKYLTCKELSLRVLAEEIIWGVNNGEFKFGHSFGSFQNQLTN